MLLYQWYRREFCPLNTTIITVGSVTMAQKAKRLLSDGGFRTKLVKLNTTKNGCTYGLSIKNYSMLEVAKILRDGNVIYSVHSTFE